MESSPSHIVACTIWLLCTIICFSDTGLGQIIQLPTSDKWTCINGQFKDDACVCDPCWTGSFCNEKVNTDVPSFHRRYDYVELSDVDMTFIYNASACQGGLSCPCEYFVYNIPDEDEENRFQIDGRSGSISLTKPMKIQGKSQSELFTLRIEVQNILTNMTDTMELNVMLVKEPGFNNMYDQSADYLDGYRGSEIHHRAKRASIPNEVVFTLTELGTIPSTLKAGTATQFQLDIAFPTTSTDMLVELYSPDITDTIMILCDVTVDTSGATNLQFSGAPATVIKEGKPADPSYIYDRAKVVFGTVSHIGGHVDDATKSTISILYKAIMLPNVGSTATLYYIAAGAEYDSGNNLWVGIAGYTTDFTPLNVRTPLLSLPGTISLDLGSSYLVTFGLVLPLEYAAYTVDIFTPFNTTDIGSICSMRYVSSGSNFACGNPTMTATATLTPATSGKGNYRGTLNLGSRFNIGTDMGSPDADNTVTVEFVMLLFDSPTFVGQTVTFGVSLDVQTTGTVYVGGIDVDVQAASNAGTVPGLAVTSPTSFNINTNQPFELYMTLSIPAPTVPGTATKYVLEILTEISTTAVFKICSLEVISVGANLVCLDKDDVIPVYSSRLGSAITDKVVLPLDYVTNMDLSAVAADDDVMLKLILVTTDNPLVTLTSVWNVVFGMEVGASAITLATTAVTVQGNGLQTSITLANAPTFSMTFLNNVNAFSVGGAGQVDIEMTTSRDIFYPQMSIEFMTSTGATTATVKICQARISSVGKNLPCLTKNWYNDRFSYAATYGNEEYDISSLDLDSLCNTLQDADPAEDKSVFQVFFKILDNPQVTDGSSHTISAGFQYSGAQLWIGLATFSAQRNVNIIPGNTPYTSLTLNSTAGNVVLGTVAVYSYLIKIHPGDKADTVVTVTAGSESLSICGIRVASAGWNIPCVSIHTMATYVTSSTGVKSSATLDLDILRNVGSDSLVLDDNFDSSSVILEILVQATPGHPTGTYSFVTHTTFSTDLTSVDIMPSTSITTTADVTSLDQTIGTPVTGIFSVNDFTDTGDTSANIAFTESKLLVYTMVIPESTQYNINLDFVIPATSVGKLKICYAAFRSAGINLPCVNKIVTPTYQTAPDYTSASMVFGYVCSSPIRAGDVASNTLEVEVLVKLMSSPAVNAGDQVSITSAITLNGAFMVVGEMFLTVAAEGSHEDVIKNTTGITNSTMVSIGPPTTIQMRPGEIQTINVTITVPTFSSASFLFDADLPASSTSACLTVSAVRVSAVGINLGCVEIESMTFTQAIPATGQNTYVLANAGIVVNTGYTHRLGKYSAGDDDVVFQLDIQMADCSLSANNFIHKLSIGNKMATFIVIYEHDVQVSRNVGAIPHFLLSLTATTANNIVTLRLTLEHTLQSSAEGQNTQVYVYLPYYQQGPTSVNTSSKPHTLTQPSPGLLVITFDDVYFTDVIGIDVVVTTDQSVAMSPNYSASKTTCGAEVDTDFVKYSTFYDSSPWYPYPIFAAQNVEYSVTAGTGSGCSSVLGLGNNGIQNCQIIGSPDSRSDAFRGRKGGSNAWLPFIMDSHKRMQFFRVNFGNVAKVTKIDIEQNVKLNKVTGFDVSYSNDGISWWSGETINLPSVPADLESYVLMYPKASRQIRIANSADDASTASDVGLKFEFYGCFVAGSLSGSALCAQSSFAAPTNYYSRSFVVGTANTVFVCALKPNAIDTFDGQCDSSSDGFTWKTLDDRLSSILGYNPVTECLYGYANDRLSIMASVDNGLTFSTVDDDLFIDSAAKSNFVPSINIPLDIPTDLAGASPASTYTIGSWGATYEGMFLYSGGWSLRLKWATCC